MLGRDLSSTAETQQQLVKAQLAIERGYEERRDFDARYRMLLATMQEPVVFVSANDGRIKDINAAAINLFGQNTNDLEGSVFSQLFKNRRRGEFQDALLAISSKDQNSDMTVEDVKLGRRFKIKAYVALTKDAARPRQEDDEGEGRFTGWWRRFFTPKPPMLASRGVEEGE